MMSFEPRRERRSHFIFRLFPDRIVASYPPALSAEIADLMPGIAKAAISRHREKDFQKPGSQVPAALGLPRFLRTVGTA